MLWWRHQEGNYTSYCCPCDLQLRLRETIQVTVVLSDMEKAQGMCCQASAGEHGSYDAGFAITGTAMEQVSAPEWACPQRTRSIESRP